MGRIAGPVCLTLSTLLAVSGCHRMFGLIEVSDVPSTDGGVDADDAAPPDATTCFVADLSSMSLDSAIWSWYADTTTSLTVEDGGVVMRLDGTEAGSYTGFSTRDMYSLTGAWLEAEIERSAPPEHAAAMRMELDSSNVYSIHVDDQITFATRSSVTSDPRQVAYDATAMRFLRIRHDPFANNGTGEILFETRPDVASAWVNRHRTEVLVPTDSLEIKFYFGTDVMTPQGGTATFRGIQLCK